MDNRSLIYNHNPMKKINPEDLVVGRKYLVELEYKQNDEDGGHPLCFLDGERLRSWYTKSTPIYTHEESNDIELEMLVNVASRLWSSYAQLVSAGLCDRPSNNELAKEAVDLITVCKNAIKKGER